MISRDDGSVLLTEIEQISQSVADILTTPIGSRVMRRDYGSLLADLIDQPINDALLLKIYSAVYTALFIWEDRISIENIRVLELQQGALTLNLDAVLTGTSQQINLNIPLKMGAVT